MTQEQIKDEIKRGVAWLIDEVYPVFGLRP